VPFGAPWCPISRPHKFAPGAARRWSLSADVGLFCQCWGVFFCWIYHTPLRKFEPTRTTPHPCPSGDPQAPRRFSAPCLHCCAEDSERAGRIRRAGCARRARRLRVLRPPGAARRGYPGVRRGRGRACLPRCSAAAPAPRPPLRRPAVLPRTRSRLSHWQARRARRRLMRCGEARSLCGRPSAGTDPTPHAGPRQLTHPRGSDS